MSLYNMMHGVNPNQESLLDILGLKQSDFGRYRDVFVENGYIVVHTRNGGGNREDHEDVFDELNKHHLYSHDEDCDFDCTYANVYFKIPDELASLVALCDQGTDPSIAWVALMESLK